MSERQRSTVHNYLDFFGRAGGLAGHTFLGGPAATADTMSAVLVRSDNYENLNM